MPLGNPQEKRYSLHLSVPGPKRKDKPEDQGGVNQDESLSWVDEDLGIHVVAVADGHGSAQHCRSDIGALFAVQCVIARIKQFVHSDSTVVRDENRFDDFNTWWTGTLFPAVHADWISRVKKHLNSQCIESERWPFPNKESSEGTYEIQKPIIQYGTTLLVGLSCGNLVALGQVGDGLVITAGKQVKCPLQLGVNLDHTTNETHSLCNDNPKATFKAFKGQKPPRLVFLCSDGIDDGFASIADVKKWIAELSSSNDILKRSVFESKLKENTKAISKNSGDDATVALIFSPDGDLPEIEAASAADPVSPAPPIIDDGPVVEPSDLKDQELSQTQTPSAPPLSKPTAPKEQE